MPQPDPQPSQPLSSDFSELFSSLQSDIQAAPSSLQQAITAAYRMPEAEAVQALLAQEQISDPTRIDSQILAKRLVLAVRQARVHASGIDALMHQFALSSEGGIALMCLAESLLRIPDQRTVDRLIADKIGPADWEQYLGRSSSMFVNAATWGLLVTGKIVRTPSAQTLKTVLTQAVARWGAPLIRSGVAMAIRMLGNQFVLGQTIEEALHNSQAQEERGYRYSYDMLGESALTKEDATHYFAAYEEAIHAIGQASQGRGIQQGAGISVKLSALHPRYSRAKHERVMAELLPRLLQLLRLAKSYDIGLNIDAEEADRLELSLAMMEKIAFDQSLAGYAGVGFVVQAYQKRCPYVIDYLVDLAKRSGRKMMIRLVKGAYWDAEIKRAQVDGLSGYPVFTRKVHTDVSYLVCAQKLLDASHLIYPQFATHNAHTVATIYQWAKAQGVEDYEFQCLHGMGETLYDQVVGSDHLDRPCRIYAPVGSHRTLLAYLVRRLLENGANSSFVNQIVDEQIPVADLIADPFNEARLLNGQPHPQIVLPKALYAPARKNSAGLDLSNEQVLRDLAGHAASWASQSWQAFPTLNNELKHNEQPIYNPADRRDVVGRVVDATLFDVEQALTIAEQAKADWSQQAPKSRAAWLERAADLFEQHRLELCTLAIREAGKTWANAVGEVREAVDFLRYYAAQTRFEAETDAQALGLVVCISPWNFPLAIFVGQVSAALAAGNVVLAKPAEQTPLMAARAVSLLHEAGIPAHALQLLPGRGETIGAALVADARVDGVVFTGSTQVAQMIHHTLIQRAVQEGRDIPLIAETGGQNAMVVDSSALLEQVVQDVLVSAFDSAGQRCSALRVLCLQQDIADQTIAMLKGAMQELQIGRPDQWAVDIGPVIDADAQRDLLDYIESQRAVGKVVTQQDLPESCQHGFFIAPTLIEIDTIAELKREVFGPVLHIWRYERDQLPDVVQAVNASGFGLTMGVHSRIDQTIQDVVQHAHVGNIYINRSIVGAVVGVQPFGGEGKSGTGPKAGGPLYLKRLQRTSAAEVCTHHATVIKDQSVVERNVLSDLAQWVRTQDSVLFDFIAAYQRTSLLGTSFGLVSPTGEQNTLSFVPRGGILCHATTLPTLINQLLAVLLTGNTPVLDVTAQAVLPKALPPSLQGIIQSESDHSAIIGLILSDTPLTSSLAETMLRISEQTGHLLSYQLTTAYNPIPLWRLMIERALCVNTTAVGGNASLMMLQADTAQNG
ncbi:bifunctional proline dehydrogenase/L-glutamate gamma-semialdehyde dehydrogenase PutA [Aquirhabdus parva]|uniref:Bifunctional protein PutA n=1 Tax=Aquirhabdus parva TaxID=2283318 RepID=A0A345PA67_9GAMM|nr:bifunctional proline dehydrogenase/L-glutamate gamma-semialdehyde dehydrogenase PutA [Aquirhabdus parva]AXI04176.1 bifunctional proline dehydrogenase/L-glutamate gamma-semialdehyde dehydrogenase PutA [Aquirhabdus parva]